MNDPAHRGLAVLWLWHGIPHSCKRADVLVLPHIKSPLLSLKQWLIQLWLSKHPQAPEGTGTPSLPRVMPSFMRC